MNNKGYLITFEGADGAGKHSQTLLLKDYLESKGKNVKVYSFPNYDSLIGEVISKYLRGQYGDIYSIPHELLCIAYSSNRVKIQNELKEYIDQGYIVICDRYSHSNIFSAAKLPEKEWDSFIEWSLNVEFNELNVIKPDHTFYLYIDNETTLKRIKERGKREYQKDLEDIHESNENLLMNVVKCYLKYGSNQDSKKWTSINQMCDGQQLSKDIVSNIIIEKVNNLLSL